MLSALLLLTLVVAVAARAATEAPPLVKVHRTLGSYIEIPGVPPHLAWPVEGEAAVEVEHIGSFGSSGPRTPVPIASVAKMMTAYLTLEEHPLTNGSSGFTIIVTPSDVLEEQRRAAEDQSVTEVRAGERLTERQALEALLLPSANNVAAMLARRDAGSIPAFVARMNEEARSLHMDSTHYTDPSGFEETTVSTPGDQIRLVEAAMRNPTFASIVAKRTSNLPVVGEVYNYNGLVGEEGYEGVKTGSDSAAGGCLAFVKRIVVAGRHLTVVGVVLGQHDGPLVSAALASARRLGNSAAAAVRVRDALAAGTEVDRLISEDGGNAIAVSTQTLRAIGWPGLRLPAHLSDRDSGGLRRVHGGQRIGSIAIGGSDPSQTSVRVRGSIKPPSLGWRLNHLL